MKIKRILLIVPPAFTLKSLRDINPLPPLGLGYLASVIENMGIEVKILDCLMRGWNHLEKVDDTFSRVGMPDDEIRAFLCEFDPDIVGINCQFSRQYKIYHQMLCLIKDVKPDCITLAGGAHVTVCPEEVLQDQSCDFILRGEAENSIEDFIKALNQGTGLDYVDGLGWKSNGNLIINEKTKWISNLDTIPFPAYHLMELDRYFGMEVSHGKRHRIRFCPIVTSRGCPAKCTFCSAHKVWGNKLRTRSVDNVLEEMKLLKNQYGIEEIMFEDDNVTANPKRAIELFSRMIEERLDFVWDTPNGVGVWSIDEKMIDLMKESGCLKINFPVESGSQYVVDNIIHKPIKLSRIKELVKYCATINMDYGMFLVIGLPGEKIDDIWQSFRYAADCGCYSPHISVATPYPGTKLYDQCLNNGYFSKKYDLEDLFIRSFLIRTPDWDKNDLKKTLLKGHIYLIIRNIIDQPVSALKRFARLAKYPSRIIDYIKLIK